MKHLVMATPLPIPIPPELFQPARDWIGERIADQRFDCVYLLPGGGGVAISNTESHEELNDELLAYPLYGYYDWAVEPLVDWEHGFNTIINRIP